MELFKFNHTEIKAPVRDLQITSSELSLWVAPEGFEILGRLMHSYYGTIEKTENGEKWCFGAAVGTSLSAYLEFLDDDGNAHSYKVAVPFMIPWDQNLSDSYVYLKFPRLFGD